MNLKGRFVQGLTRFFWCYLSLVVAVVVSISVAINLCPDTDSYFLISTGRYILENHIVPHINPFSIVENLDMIVQQWLPCILNAWLYDTFGLYGLTIGAVLMNLITLTCLWYFIKSELGANNGVLSGILVLLCQIALQYYINTRPSMISCAVLVLELICLTQYRKTSRPKYLILLPLLSLFEINWHASLWPFMFVLLLPFIVPRFWTFEDIKSKKYRKNALNILGAASLMFAVGFLNPNGWAGMTYLLSSYSTATSGIAIGELTAAEFFSAVGIMLMIELCLFFRYVHVFKHQASGEIVYLFVGTSLMAMLHIRNIWFTLLPFVPIACSLFKSTFEKVTFSKNRMYSAVAVIALLFCANQLLDSATALSKKVSGDYSDMRSLPESCISCVEYLESYDKDTLRIFTDFNTGAYFEFYGYPVFIDARPEIYESGINHRSDIYTEYCSVYLGTADYPSFISKYNFTHIIVEKENSFYLFLKYNSSDCGYALIYENDDCAMYESIAYLDKSTSLCYNENKCFILQEVQ